MHFFRFLSTFPIIGLIVVGSLSTSAFAVETTRYGKITGIETRGWGMHVQVDFSAGAGIGCAVTPGQPYMLDLHRDYVSINGGNYDLVQAVVFSAFLAGRDVSFHLYECSSDGNPYIGHVRVK